MRTSDARFNRFLMTLSRNGFDTSYSLLDKLLNDLARAFVKDGKLKRSDRIIEVLNFHGVEIKDQLVKELIVAHTPSKSLEATKNTTKCLTSQNTIFEYQNKELSKLNRVRLFWELIILFNIFFIF